MLKKAEMSIYAALIAFAIILIMVPITQLYQLNTQTKRMEKNIEEGLIDIISLNSIINYDTVKYSNGSVYEINDEKVTDSIFISAGFIKESYEYEKEGIIVKDVEIKFDSIDNSIILSYEMNVPFKMLGKTVRTAKFNRIATAYFQKR